jgi:hypothetical protein
MSFTEEQKWSILDQAKRTLERTSPEKLQESRLVYEENYGGHTTLRQSEPIGEDRVEKWKREKTAIMEDREREKARNGIVERTYTAVVRLDSDVKRIESEVKHDLVHALKGINAYAEAIYGRVEELSADVDNLRTKLVASEAKVDELTKKLEEKPPSFEPPTTLELARRRTA